jgi:signal transduction histidine kinase
MPEGVDIGERFRQAGRPVAIALLAGAYWGAARFGLSFATVGKSITLIWPPTGISLVALTLGGLGCWPGVALGAFAVNALTPGVPLEAAAGMALGNTLEAVAGAYLLRRSSFVPKLERVADVLLLLLLAALLSTVVSATIGSLSLLTSGVLPASQFLGAWRVWWVGDMMGDLVVAPLLFTLSTAGISIPPRQRIAEAGALIGLLGIFAFIAFVPSAVQATESPGTYVLFPFLVWAALRFGQLGVAATNFVAIAIAIWATLRGTGPFARETLDGSLLSLDSFMAVVAMSSLLLGSAVAERNRAIRVRDDFLSVASHELRTPLTTLRMQLDRLQRAPRGDGADALGAKILLALNRPVRRITTLVEELLDASRIEGGRLALEPSLVDLCELVREVLQELSPDMAEARCSVELDAATPLVGRWDRMWLRHVVSNLLTNAMRFGAGKPVSVALSRLDGTVRLEVRDRGIGIDESDQERIFGRFERAVSARNYSGFGLGLYIVRRIVEAHAGAIRVESQLGEGARFIVELPTEPRYS